VKKKCERTTLAYFDGDELATNVFMTNIVCEIQKGNFVEKTPDDMHRALRSEFARMEDKVYWWQV
jgi:ribonucleoside-diphosphate reductase alpha chain